MRDVPTLRTERFALRPLLREDAAALLPTLAEPDNCRFLTHAAFASEEELWNWLSDPTWKGRSWIAEDANGEVVGRFVAIPAHQAGVEEIGYITVAHRVKERVARECTSAIMRQLIEEEGARKLIAEVDMRNTASIRLLESLGFMREALFREHETTHIGMCDVAVYGLLAADYECPSQDQSVS